MSQRSAAGGVETVLFIGLGAMGTLMATRLALGKFQLLVHDIDEKRANSFAKDVGAVALPSLTKSDLVDVDVALLMLPDSNAVEDVLLRDGLGLLSLLDQRAIIIDMGSSHPSSTTSLAKTAKLLGFEMGDAPVSGGVSRATTGELSIMFGGSEVVLERVRPVLNTLGTKIFHTGPTGSGHAMKALNNLLSAIGIVAATEVLSIGSQFGLDPHVMVDVLNASTGRNQATEVKFEKHILSRSFDSGFSLKLMVKDLNTALDLAHHQGSYVPLSAVCLETWLGAQHQLKDSSADHTEVIKFIEKVNEIKLR